MSESTAERSHSMGKRSALHPRLQRASSQMLLLFLCAVCGLASGQGQSTSALGVPLILPSAVVFDSSGNFYVAETASHVVRKVDTSGHITTIAGTGAQGFSGDGGPAIAAWLDSPQGLALDTANNLYIADTHNHRIRRVSLGTGVISTVAGTGAPGFSGDNGSATAAELNLPTAPAVDAANNLYFADTGNHRIRRMDARTGLISTVAGTGTQGFSGDNGPAVSAAIDSPTGLAVSAGSVYLADTHNHRIRAIGLSSGVITTLAGTGTQGFSGDSSVASAATLALPHGLTLDSSGNLYLADTENDRIRRIDAATGVITTIAGSGTESFSGDNGPAVAASLDSPRGVTFSPANLLTLADTGNQRVRQLEASAAPATQIQTIAGIGTASPGSLTLSAPPVIVYGTGQIVATLATTDVATGNIDFVNTGNGFSSPLGSFPLISNQAVLSTGTLPAGLYSLTATYSGDQSHLSAQSPAVVFRVAPQVLRAVITSASAITYGQQVPVLTGTLSGVLPRDADKVTVYFSTSASALSPVGSYPITASLTGAAASNYTLAAIASDFMISPAATTTAFSDLAGSAASGIAINFTTQVTSTAAGVPTGSVILLDGSTQIATAPLSQSGVANFSNIILAPGAHNLVAVYNGNANFASSTSSLEQITISSGSISTPTPPPVSPPPPVSTPPPAPVADFTLASSGAASQTISSGAAASFTFSVQPQGSLSSPVTLAASGLPNLATASFNPPAIPSGTSSNTFTLTISTPNTTASNRAAASTWAVLLLPFVGLAFGLRARVLPCKLLTFALLGIVSLAATGCGDRVNTASSATVAASKSYIITVTGTSTSSSGSILQHSTTVTLVIQPAS